nr:hypothetical protein [Tanacetum cinerariifolium]
MSMDDLYNHLKVYEPKVKGMSSSSLSTQNMAFVSSSNNNTSSTNGVVNTAQAGVSTASTQVNVAYFTNTNNLSDAVICSFFASQPNSPQLVHDDLEQIRPDDMEEMNLRWQMAMWTMRARRFLNNTRRKLAVNGIRLLVLISPIWSATIAIRGDIRECRALRNQDNKHKESSRRSVPVETSASTALVSCDSLGGYEWSDQAEEWPNYALMAFLSLSSNLEVSNDSTCSKPFLETVKLLKSQNGQLLKETKKSELMVLVPPHDIGNFMPLTPDLSFTGLDEFVNKPVVENYKSKFSKEEPKVVRKNSDALVIEEGCQIIRKMVDYNYHQKQFQNQRMVKPVWNNAHRVNHQNFAKKTHPYAKTNMVPRAVLMKSGLASINTARQVNAAHSKTTVNAARPMTYLSKIIHSNIKRLIHKNTSFKNVNINQRVNTNRVKKFNTTRPKAVVNVVKGNNSNVVKASACCVWKPKHKVLDYVSKHNSASITLKKFDYVDAQGRS